MTTQWSVPAWALLVTLGVVLVVAAALALVARRSAARAAALAASARSEAESLRAQVEAIEHRLAVTARSTRGAEEAEYVITRLGDDPDGPSGEDGAGSREQPSLDGPLFADLVLRESVVQAASFAAGLRRAFDPAHLNRIRFEMRRELKRARKQRRADARQARREYEARQRAGDAAA
ncbi:MAG: hypothetical protein OSB43_11880 [Nocardioides sp.]|uniref:hypothetical protein n=1 Tax=Nocardioides sp. TaxID=35761 RepID=UPI00238F0C24|nr:hypothetical protein [Nocardioides sp.]MDE0776965.1 hypothetical protein [Nocardioides sp.]